jgi:hypothetical protein
VNSKCEGDMRHFLGTYLNIRIREETSAQRSGQTHRLTQKDTIVACHYLPHIIRKTDSTNSLHIVGTVFASNSRTLPIFPSTIILRHTSVVSIPRQKRNILYTDVSTVSTWVWIHRSPSFDEKQEFPCHVKDDA